MPSGSPTKAAEPLLQPNTAAPVQCIPVTSTQAKGPKKQIAGMAMDCKHAGCTAKLIIGAAKQKQVIGSHTHVLCQRNCWTCRNFVDAYMKGELVD